MSNWFNGLLHLWQMLCARGSQEGASEMLSVGGLMLQEWAPSNY